MLPHRHRQICSSGHNVLHPPSPGHCNGRTESKLWILMTKSSNARIAAAGRTPPPLQHPNRSATTPPRPRPPERRTHRIMRKIRKSAGRRGPGSGHRRPNCPASPMTRATRHAAASRRPQAPVQVQSEIRPAGPAASHACGGHEPAGAPDRLQSSTTVGPRQPFREPGALGHHDVGDP